MKRCHNEGHGAFLTFKICLENESKMAAQLASRFNTPLPYPSDRLDFLSTLAVIGSIDSPTGGAVGEH
jgi:hypothetical protein